MARRFIGRISFPHQLAESPGSFLLFENTLSEEKRILLKKLKTEEFRGLEYRCTNVKCREPVGLSQFKCNVCSEPLEIKVDVIEQDGKQKILPSTARAWCSNNHKFTYGKKFHGRCPIDGAELEYGLAGNEKTEFALWMCLAISQQEVGKTTPHYQAFLSSKDAAKALDILTTAGCLKKESLDIILGKYCKKPDYFVLTEKGLEKRKEYMTILQKYDLLDDFRIFLPKREEELRNWGENPKEKNVRYFSVLENMPAEIKKSLLLDALPASRFKMELPKAIRVGVADEIKTWLHEWYRDNADVKEILSQIKPAEAKDLLFKIYTGEDSIENYVEQKIQQYDNYIKIARQIPAEEIIKEIKEKILNLCEIKYRGLKVILTRNIKSNKLDQNEINWLEELWANQISGVRVNKSGIIYSFEIKQRRKDAKPFVVEHIPSLYHKDIFLADKTKIDWSRYAQPLS